MIRTILAGILLCLAASAANASSTATPLRLLLGTAPPWIYYDQACKPAGIVVDLFDAIARRSLVPMQFVYVPFEEERAALLDGRLDGDINELDAWFDENLIRIAPVLALEEVLVGHAEGTGHDDPPRRIGHVVTYGSRSQTLADMSATVIEFDSYEDLVEAYLAERLDAVAGIKETLLFHLYRQGARPSILRTLKQLQTLNVWLFVSPRVSAAERARLAAVLDMQALAEVLAKARTMHLGAHRLRAPREPGECQAAESAPSQPD